MNSSVKPSVTNAWLRHLTVLCCLAWLVVACSSTPPHYAGAFSTDEQVGGNADSIPASMNRTWDTALEILAQQGFLIQNADATSRIILANREMRDTDDDELSYTISATLTFVPGTQDSTRLIMAANQTTQRHEADRVWWKLLWLIPIFPIRTEYTTTVVDRDTIKDTQFYSDFFAAVRSSCAGTAPSQTAKGF